MNVQSIVGSGNNRDEHDFYPTPPEVTEALFARESFIGTVLEPASGNGSMSKVIEKYHPCISSDIRPEGYGIGNINFLTSSQQADNIITNPPYKLAKEFVEHAKVLSSRKVAMFLKLVFLEGQGRYQMFQDQEFPLATVYVFSKRVALAKSTDTRKHSGLIAYAWFIWDKEHKGQATIQWIN